MKSFQCCAPQFCFRRQACCPVSSTRALAAPQIHPQVFTANKQDAYDAYEARPVCPERKWGRMVTEMGTYDYRNRWKLNKAIISLYNCTHFQHIKAISLLQNCGGLCKNLCRCTSYLAIAYVAMITDLVWYQLLFNEILQPHSKCHKIWCYQPRNIIYFTGSHTFLHETIMGLCKGKGNIKSYK